MQVIIVIFILEVRTSSFQLKFTHSLLRYGPIYIGDFGQTYISAHTVAYILYAFQRIFSVYVDGPWSVYCLHCGCLVYIVGWME